MDNTQPNDLAVIAKDAPPCRHLRSKGMYVYTDLENSESHDDYDCTAYWCLKTMKNFGPDDDMVGSPDCRNRARSCYEPI